MTIITNHHHHRRRCRHRHLIHINNYYKGSNNKNNYSYEFPKEKNKAMIVEYFFNMKKNHSNHALITVAGFELQYPKTKVPDYVELELCGSEEQSNNKIILLVMFQFLGLARAFPAVED